MLEIKNPGHDGSIGEILNFSAVESAYEGHVSVALAVKLNDGSTRTFSVRLPADRAQGWAEKLNHAIGSALRHAPRRV